MKLQVCSKVILLLATAALAQGPQAQTPQDEILQVTRQWLIAISTGDRVILNRIMDARCLLTTPGGDILSKERLVPNDESLGVQTLSPMELSGPIVRIYADTAVLMTHLKPTGGGQESVGTFVYGKQGATWKLVALHLTARK